MLINERVCEGCGDCSEQSHCLSVEPLETEFGRKRAINQSSCNKDFSCLKGFCPSFVTVEGGKLRKPQPLAPEGAIDDALPAPAVPGLARPYGVFIVGVGGTGVVTIGQLLGISRAGAVRCWTWRAWRRRAAPCIRTWCWPPRRIS